MFSGQFTNRKQPLFFADIAIAVAKQIPNLNLLILGEGPLKEKFMTKLDEENINYTYPGYASQEELPGYYTQSKLFLFPTLLDAWGVVVNESMASGTPVLTSPYAGVYNDLVIDDKTGYNLELDLSLWVEKVILILQDKTLWKSLSEGARERAKDFNFEIAAQGIIEAAKYTKK
jgi:glycosyltransferase involved in cell wall biosynthesis